MKPEILDVLARMRDISQNAGFPARLLDEMHQQIDNYVNCFSTLNCDDVSQFEIGWKADWQH